MAPAPPLVWSRVASGTTEVLYDVWGSSATDVWAVGFNGTIVHYDGTRWTRALEGVSHVFQGVWGSGTGDVWVVGFRSFTDASPVIFHYDGRAWSPIVSVADSLPFALLTDVWGTSASNVWAVGYGGTILHFNGTRWTNASVDNSLNAERIWGSSETDAWIVGPHTVLRYDGHRWSSQTGEARPSLQLTVGWGTDRTSHWAGGVAGQILRFDGSAWTRVASEETDGIGTFYGMWGAMPSRIWAVVRGGIRGPGAVVQYDGTRWTVVARDTASLYGVWGRSASDVWAVGAFGAILHGTPAP